MANQIGLKSIAELFGTNFEIPNYQRGYRWTEQQVKDLLEDINDYEENSQQFYCLQPLVVKKCKVDEDIIKNRLLAIKTNVIEEAKKILAEKWEVIDGQQRLTTINILLTYLKVKEIQGKPLYSLFYVSREGSTDFLKEIQKSSNDENIDFYHMSKAYTTIHEWFNEKGIDTSSFGNKLLNHVKFIWYESNDEDAIKVFTRLNIGKISLTNSELIKALFLNRSNFEKGSDSLRLTQQEIASEWDNIEYQLQNDDFWLFIHNLGYNHPTRIDYIFDLICKENKLKITTKTGNDKYRTFRYFYEYFKPNNQHDIMTCWHLIKEYFRIFEEWYNDLELYHYLGFLISLSKKDTAELVESYMRAESKQSFAMDIKRDVLEIVHSCPDINFQYDDDGSNKRLCRPILLFHNIQTVINQNRNYKNKKEYGQGIFYKFPFHLFKKESWDVEHINSLTTNPEENVETKKSWLLSIYCSIDEEKRKIIEDAFDNITDDKICNAYNSIKEIVKPIEEWSDSEKNRIWNYTLLDSSTNRSYGNSIFSAKRRIVIGKNKGKLIPVPHKKRKDSWEFPQEIDAETSFVPPCTLNVFLKYYSTTVNDFNYWDKTFDAKMYEMDITRCINQLTNEVNSSNNKLDKENGNDK